jgi:hypothetical protein
VVYLKEKLYGYQPKFWLEAIVSMAGGLASETYFVSQHLNDRLETNGQIIAQAAEVAGSLGGGMVLTATVVGGIRLANAKRNRLAEDIDGTGRDQNNSNQSD